MRAQIFHLKSRYQNVFSHLLLVFAIMVFSTAFSRPAAAQIQIVAMGDSLTAGYGLRPEQAFPSLLEAALRERGYDVKITNAGISGDTTTGGLARLGPVINRKPDIVIVQFGANDAFRGTSPQIAFNNLDAMITRLHEAGATVVLAGMRAPLNLGKSYVDVFNSVYEKLANKHDDIIYYPFFLKDVALVHTLNLGDGIHPNEAGVRVIVKNILPYMEEALEKRGFSQNANW